MTITANIQHVQQALQTLIEVFKNKTNLSALITACVTQLQELDNVFMSLYTDRWINNAEGAQLDGIGRIVGEERQGRTDTDYRDAIKIRIGINLGSGTTEDVIEVVVSLFDAMTVRIIEHYPAGFTLKLSDPVDPGLNTTRIKAYIQSITPAGVGFILEFFVEDPFQYDEGFGYDEGKYAGAI